MVKSLRSAAQEERQPAQATTSAPASQPGPSQTWAEISNLKEWDWDKQIGQLSPVGVQGVESAGRDRSIMIQMDIHREIQAESTAGRPEPIAVKWAAWIKGQFMEIQNMIAKILEWINKIPHKGWKKMSVTYIS